MDRHTDSHWNHGSCKIKGNLSFKVETQLHHGMKELDTFLNTTHLNTGGYHPLLASLVQY